MSCIILGTDNRHINTEVTVMPVAVAAVKGQSRCPQPHPNERAVTWFLPVGHPHTCKVFASWSWLPGSWFCWLLWVAKERDLEKKLFMEESVTKI